jgi:high-affinity iron transporter
MFVGIVAAATRGVAGRARWLAIGVAAGVLGALALAAGADQVSALADGIGQDLVNVGILSVALAMLAWHCIWVSTHGQEMSMDARRLGSSVREGSSGPRALMVAVALAVLREGAETVLFVAGLATGAAADWQSMMAAAGMGLLGGVALGSLIYFGLSRVKPQHLFAVTNVLILVLAAAIASQLARALAQSGLVDLWSGPVWDSSRLLATDSPVGVVLHALAGYDATPSGLQLAFYVGTLAIIGIATRQVRNHQRQRVPLPPSRPLARAR